VGEKKVVDDPYRQGVGGVGVEKYLIHDGRHLCCCFCPLGIVTKIREAGKKLHKKKTIS